MKDAKGHGSNGRGAAAAGPGAHAAAINNLPPRSGSGLGKFAGNLGKALLGAAAGVVGTVVSGALRAQSRGRGRR